MIKCTDNFIRSTNYRSVRSLSQGAELKFLIFAVFGAIKIVLENSKLLHYCRQIVILTCSISGAI
jgi:hypothetical protein